MGTVPSIQPVGKPVPQQEMRDGPLAGGQKLGRLPGKRAQHLLAAHPAGILDLVGINGDLAAQRGALKKKLRGKDMPRRS